MLDIKLIRENKNIVLNDYKKRNRDAKEIDTVLKLDSEWRSCIKKAGDMKAGWYKQFGDAKDVIEIGEMDTPEVGTGDVLVRIHASGVNPSDVKKRAGYGYPFTEERIIPHSDGAGMIEQVALEVGNFYITGYQAVSGKKTRAFTAKTQLKEKMDKVE